MRGDKSEITRLDYRPPGVDLDIEIFQVSELRQRATHEELRASHRYEFHLIICVTQGTPIQFVDFHPVACAPGSVVVIRPGQLHDFGRDTDWEGWMLLFRSEFLRASIDGHPNDYMLEIERLPVHLLLGVPALRTVTQSIVRMRADTRSIARLDTVQALLKHELCALLLRLILLRHEPDRRTVPPGKAQQRFAKFRELVERKHASWHQVADYAAALGCTERSLTRAALDVDGRTAKQVIAIRLALEAKRLLAHTDLSIHQIAGELGFDEPTNFSKFFKRESELTPAFFRRRHRSSTRSLPAHGAAGAKAAGR